MSVKVKDRNISNKECLQKSRELIDYILILTRPRDFKDGKQIRKPGILGEGQPLQVFGYDLLKCGKRIHALCYQASKIYIKNEESFKERKEYYTQALNYCDSIFREIDLCIYHYARNNKKKKNSFIHLSKLNQNLKQSIYTRLNLDKLIYEHNYRPEKKHVRGR